MNWKIVVINFRMYYLLLLISFLPYIVSQQSVRSSSRVTYIEPGIQIDFTPKLGLNDNLQIYCYAGRPKYIVNIWRSVLLKIDIRTDDYVLYDGPSAEDVLNEYEAHRSQWTINLFSGKRKEIKLDPFNQSCIGIDSAVKYSVILQVIRIDYWKVLLLSAGILLFLSAPKLSNNPLFYYICGITFGVCASFLFLIYFASKLFPKKPMMYGFVLGGWTISVYLIQFLWENVRTIFISYQMYVLYYALISGLISFVVCYRMGPVTNPRSKNLIKWSLQLIGLLTMFFSSQFQEAAMGCVVILLTIYNFPNVWVAKSKAYWKRKFPPRVQLITNQEYYQQGVRETTKALSNLREYCSSPECNQWKTVLKLKDAKRFASFIEGSSHLSDEEMLEYENESILWTGRNLTDDEVNVTDDSSSSIEL